MLRNAGPLSEDEELIVHEVIGAGIAVHQALGPGYLESIYRKGMCVELKARALRFETERLVDVEYRGECLGSYRLDLVVQELVVVELKAVERFDPVHRSQVVAYLKATGLRIGFLMNFNTPALRHGLQRVVL
jgi:GxxExxY protein